MRLQEKVSTDFHHTCSKICLGAYLHGLYMEGARWDTQQGAINESKLKELTPAMPVLFVKAIPIGMIFESS